MILSFIIEQKALDMTMQILELNSQNKYQNELFN